MHKIKAGTLTTGTVKNNFKGTIEKFVSSDNAFSLWAQSKEHQHAGNKFLYDVLAFAKQLGIPTYYLTLLRANLRWEELPYIIRKLKQHWFSDKKLTKLSYEE